MSETKSELLARIVKTIAGSFVSVGHNTHTNLHIVYCNIPAVELMAKRKKELTAFYKKLQPEKIADVGTLLANYPFVDIVASLQKKYEEVPTGWDAASESVRLIGEFETNQEAKAKDWKAAVRQERVRQQKAKKNAYNALPKSKAKQAAWKSLAFDPNKSLEDWKIIPIAEARWLT